MEKQMISNVLMACCFDMSADFELPDQMSLRVEFVTVSGENHQLLFI